VPLPSPAIRDDRVILARYDFTLGGKPAATYHYLADLETGAVTHL
jgi:hypothetical protein